MVDYELIELKREFLAEASEKVREIESVLDDPEALDRLVYLAHQLKGSGGSYGYAQISTDAAEIEKAAEQMAGGANETLSGTIRRHVTSLREAIDRSTRELTGATA